MNYSDYRVSLDIHKTRSQAVISFKKGDTLRKIYFTFMENGKPYKLGSDCTATLRAVKPDETILYNSCVVDAEKSVITYEITPQTTASPGLIDCELTLYDANMKRLTSPSFSFEINDTEYFDDDIESSNEFTELEKLSHSIKNIINSEAKRIEAENGRVSAENNRALAENKRLNHFYNGLDTLPIATEIKGGEEVPIVQDGETKKITRDKLVGTVPDNLKLENNILKLTANGETVGDSVTLPKATVDDALNMDSKNAVQNKVVAEAVDKISVKRFEYSLSFLGSYFKKNFDSLSKIFTLQIEYAVFKNNQWHLNFEKIKQPIKINPDLTLDIASTIMKWGQVRFYILETDEKTYISFDQLSTIIPAECTIKESHNAGGFKNCVYEVAFDLSALPESEQTGFVTMFNILDRICVAWEDFPDTVVYE